MLSQQVTISLTTTYFKYSS